MKASRLTVITILTLLLLTFGYIYSTLIVPDTYETTSDYTKPIPQRKKTPATSLEASKSVEIVNTINNVSYFGEIIGDDIGADIDNVESDKGSESTNSNINNDSNSESNKNERLFPAFIQGSSKNNSTNNDNNTNTNTIPNSNAHSNSNNNNNHSSHNKTLTFSQTKNTKLINKYLYHHNKSYEFPSQFFIDVCGGEDNWRGLFESFVERQKKFLYGTLEDRKKIKVIVYSLAPTTSGTGDRANGYTTVFMMALLTERAFLVDETSTNVSFSGIFQFADPSITWAFDPRLLDGLTMLDQVLIWGLRGADVAYTRAIMKKIWFEKIFNDTQLQYDVIQVRGNFPYSGLLRMNYNYADVLKSTYWSKVPFHSTHNCLMNFLLQPTPEILEATERARHTLFVNEFGENYYQIGMQIRIGGQQPTFSDPSRISSQGEKLFFNCAKQLESRVLKEWSETGREGPAPKVVFFLTTDSIETQQRAREEFKDQLRIWEGGVVHLGKTKGIAETDKISLFVQYLLLGSSNRAIVSNSTFGITSVRRGTNEFFQIEAQSDTLSCLDESETIKCDPTILSRFAIYFGPTNCSLPLSNRKLFDFFGEEKFKQWVDSKIMLEDEQVLLEQYYEEMKKNSANNKA